VIASGLRQAICSLSRSPAASLNILIFESGATTGAVSASYGLLLKPLPYPDSGSLVDLHETAADRKPRGAAMQHFLDWRARAELFEGMAACQPRAFGLTRDERQDAML
jgi:hypothetical protein